MGELSAYTNELVEYLADVASEEGISLLQAIKNASRAQIKKTYDGVVLTGVASNNSSSSFSFVSGSIRPAQIIEIIHALREMYGFALAHYIDEDNPTPTDSEILTWIRANISKIFYSGFVPDYRNSCL